jgi:hypothetical protein
VGLALAVLAAFVAATAGRAADDEAVPLRMTAGDTLSAADDAAVRATLTAYLAAVQKLDWRTAGLYVDRASFLAGVEPLVAQVAPDSTQRPAVRRRIFGVGSADSLERLPTPELFAGMMNYAMAADPSGIALMENATFRLLGARRLGDEVAIAYQLTVPAASDTTQPYVRVTAERMRRVDGAWKITVRND